MEARGGLSRRSWAVAQATLKTATLDSGSLLYGQQRRSRSGFEVPTMWSAREGAGGLAGDWSCHVGGIMEVKVADDLRETNTNRSRMSKCPGE